MQSNGYSIGGEQSGHIIFLEHAVTGDGLLTALKLLEIMCDEHKSLKELGSELFIYPQLLVNVEVQDKNAAMSCAMTMCIRSSISSGTISCEQRGTMPRMVLFFIT